ncbi:fiber protein [uncultured Mediterranean phage uvMED]|nr:fiber protein [uncultured Mediterranean phage uvMED]
MSIPGSASPLFFQTAAGAGTVTLEKSVRFNSGDSAYLNRTPSSAGSNTTWTLSTWVKKTGNDNHIFGAGAGNNPGRFGFGFNGSDKIFAFVIASGSTVFSITTDAVFRDPAGWYHIVLIADTGNSTQADRFKIYVNGVLQSVSGTLMPSSQNTFVNTTAAHTFGRRSYTASDYFNGYLASTILIDGTAKDVTDFGAFDDNGVWQVAAYSGTFGTNGFHLFDFANETGIGNDSSGNDNDFTVNNFATGNTFSTNLTPSSTAYPNTTLSNGGLSWSGSTSNDTGTVSSLTIPTNKKTYVEVTHTTTGGGDPGPGVAQGPTVELGLDSVKAWWRGGTNGSISASTLGSFSGTNTSWSNGDVLGIALDNTANSGAGSITFYKNGSQIHTGGSGWTSYTDLRFEWQNNGSGTSSGTWNYGASAFSYPVSGHTGLFEGAGANEDVLRDVPTNGTQSDTGAGGEVSGNYATWNPLFGENLTLSNGNLNAKATSSGYAIIASTVAMTSGKWYMEYHYTSNINSNGDGGNFITFGISQTNRDGAEGSGVTATAEDFGFKCWSSGFRSQTSNVNQHNYSSSVSTGDILSLAFDADAGKLWVAKNGTWMTNASGTGDPANGNNPDFSGLTYSGGYLFMAGPYSGDSLSSELEANFGARNWTYSAPSGFKALNTASLPTPMIADGSAYFDTKLYTGTGATQSITNLEFSPDMVWIKRRSGTASHVLNDTVRGAGKQIRPDLTDAEATNTNNFAAFTSDGFTVGTGSGTNASSQTHVAWAWDAGTSNTSISVGGLNSSAYNTSENWLSTGTITGTPHSAPYTFSPLFDGDLTGLGPQSNSSSTQYVYTFNSALSATAGTIIFYSTDDTVTSNNGMYINGTLVTTSNCTRVNSSSPYKYRMDSLTTLSSIGVLTTHNTTGIEVNGKLLIDSNAHTPPSVPAAAGTYRANPTAGISIVTWTGTGANATIAHGLNAAPEFIISKNRDTSSHWQCFHTDVGNNKFLELSSTGGPYTNPNVWNSTDPTSSVFSFISTANVSGNDFIAYCFAPVAGFSAFGSYSGNGDASDGNFVYLPFRPAFLLIKDTTSTGYWYLTDSARNPTNDGTTSYVWANTSGAEQSDYIVDLLSNGFRFLTGSGNLNASSRDYIYAAFAENPFQANGGLAR